MKKTLLLLDADVVINLYELGLWNTVINEYKVVVGSVVVGEVKYYRDTDGNPMPIDLKSQISDGVISTLSSTPQEMSETTQKLNKVNLDGFGAGELECITIMLNRKQDQCLEFCVKDFLAIKATSYFGLDERVLYIEDLLRKCGKLGRNEKVAYEFSRKRYERFSIEGKYLALKNPPKT